MRRGQAAAAARRHGSVAPAAAAGTVAAEAQAAAAVRADQMPPRRVTFMTCMCRAPCRRRRCTPRRRLRQTLCWTARRRHAGRRRRINQQRRRRPSRRRQHPACMRQRMPSLALAAHHRQRPCRLAALHPPAPCAPRRMRVTPWRCHRHQHLHLQPASGAHTARARAWTHDSVTCMPSLGARWAAPRLATRWRHCLPPPQQRGPPPSLARRRLASRSPVPPALALVPAGGCHAQPVAPACGLVAAAAAATTRWRWRLPRSTGVPRRRPPPPPPRLPTRRCSARCRQRGRAPR